ncbi:MAG: LLM class flavin-dependent oxidoreductase, partial [Okeania sp. SIO3B3]|nr:LLM class flavin-dependent oxidoreductase [Okeania sp. SIO3B3]
MKLAQYAESKGFEAVWQAESRLVRDAIVPMAAFAAVTENIKIGSGVINNWTRNIGLLAATFLTLDDLAPDRIICGIGAWWDPLAANVGIQRRKPLLAMHETIDVMRRLLNMENVTFDGEFHKVTGIELDVVHGRREPRNVPLMIGATGPKMMELTGEIADGAVLNYCVPPEYNNDAIIALKKGLEKSGR